MLSGFLCTFIKIDSSNAIITSGLNELSEKIQKVIFDPNLKNSLFENALIFLKYHYNIPEENPKNTLNKLI